MDATLRQTSYVPQMKWLWVRTRVTPTWVGLANGTMAPKTCRPIPLTLTHTGLIMLPWSESPLKWWVKGKQPKPFYDFDNRQNHDPSHPKSFFVLYPTSFLVLPSNAQWPWGKNAWLTFKGNPSQKKGKGHHRATGYLPLGPPVERLE